MDVRIRGVVELAHEKIIRIARSDLLGLFHGSLHAAGAGRQHDLRTVGLDQRTALQRHGVGHHQHDGIALGRRDESQSDARVAAGGLQNLHARLQHAAGFRIEDHVQGDAILHAPARVRALHLDEDRRRPFRHHAVEAHHRREAHQIVNVVHAVGSLGHGCLLEDATRIQSLLYWSSIFTTWFQPEKSFKEFRKP